MAKKLTLVAIALLIIGAFIAFRYYQYIFQRNTYIEGGTSIIHIPSNAELSDVIDTLSNRAIIKDSTSFLWVADKMKYRSPKPGRYAVSDNWSNKELITHLRSGRQVPLKLTFNNLRKTEELCELFGKELEAEAQAFCNCFYDKSRMAKAGLDSFSLLSLFIPNTYELYWNTEPEEVFNRMLKENKRFWNNDRLSKLEKLGLDKNQAYSLASIVQKETNLQSEKPVIAGVYLNRLKRDMLLQADPTVVYAVGDFEIRRVLNRHLETESPYNTYKNKGLPPGPIAMPDISTIDAVLDAQSHNYIYFCVKPGNKLEHAFAATLREHNRNAQRYRQWLNSQRIFN